MADPFIGEIRLFAGNFAPRGWAFGNGQQMSIQQNTALYAILGIQYGGDGKTYFNLPNFQNRVPIHQGQGPGLSPRVVGESDGDATVTLLTTEMPVHTHVPNANVTSTETTELPTNAIWANAGSDRESFDVYSATPSLQMNPMAIAVQGGSQPHNNMQPYMTLSFIIALEGEFPPRS